VRWVAAALVGVAIAAASFALGRASVDSDEAAGLRAGRAAGIREGRALQQPVPARQAFRAGYVAGANDAFGGFDGGWALGTPYRVTLERGDDGVTYRIKDRSKLQPGLRRGGGVQAGSEDQQ
jgi:hypothetical protein